MNLSRCFLSSLLFLSSQILVTAQTSTSAPPSLPEKKDFHLFLLAGQSNMAGRGKIDPADNQPIDGVYSLNKENAWQPALDPLHWDKPAAGVGLGRSFAKIVLQKNPGISIGLIPSACGGAPIATWFPGKYHDQTKSHPYDDAILRAKRAMEDGTLKAILWHQGESDANAKAAPLYEQKLEEAITLLRTELGAPEIPFIMGQIGRFPAKPWTPEQEAVDQAQQAVAKKMKNVYYVSSEGLTSIGDNLHFNTESQKTLAERYADVYLKIANP